MEKYCWSARRLNSPTRHRPLVPSERGLPSVASNDCLVEFENVHGVDEVGTLSRREKDGEQTDDRAHQPARPSTGSGLVKILRPAQASSTSTFPNSLLTSDSTVVMLLCRHSNTDAKAWI